MFSMSMDTRFKAVVLSVNKKDLTITKLLKKKKILMGSLNEPFSCA